MDAFAVIARLSLAAIFALSGVAKLLDRGGTHRAVEGFGLPAAVVGSVAAGLPLAECAVALALIPGTTARSGAFASLGLLAAFIVGITVNLAQGRRPDCHCFGQLHSAPVGPATLARNVVLAAAAGIVAFGAGADAGGSVPDAIGDLDATGTVLASVAIAAVIGGLFLVGRRHKGLLTGAPTASEREAKRPAGPPIGSVASPFSLVASSGGTVTFADLLARGKGVLLVFFSPGCGPCARIAPELARWQREFPDRLTIAVLSTGTAETVASGAAAYDIAEMLVDEGGAVAKSYGSRGTPGAVLIEAGGTVASEYAGGEVAIGELLLEAFGLTEVVAAVAAEKDAEDAQAGDDHHEDEDASSEDRGVDPVAPEAIDTMFVPSARADVSIGEHDGETVLIDRMSGAVHLLNPTAAIVWQCLDGTGTIDEIVVDIADVFEQDASEVTDTVLEVVRRFGRQGLLVGVGTPTEHASAPAEPAS